MGKLLSREELAGVKGIRFTPQHLLRMESRGEFPKRFSLGRRNVVWDESEIDKWIAQRKAARDEPRRPVARRRA